MSEISTIFALSSGVGRAGVAVIRVSGPQSLKVIFALCGSVPEARRASVRTLKHPQTQDILDRAMVLWLPGPGTATGEDMAEFHVHGGPALVQSLIAVLAALPGCVMAEPGAFTRRAFGNHKIDLVEAEGLGDLLAAETELQRRQAMRQFLGEASQAYAGWRKALLDCLALVEASIDFADEEGVAETAWAQVRPAIDSLGTQLKLALAASERTGMVRDGVHVAIAGPPNAGKSSLLNWLAKRDAAIVSPIAGTTRDVIEARVVMAGVPVMFSDTAGLRRETADEIEVMGMARAARVAGDSDVLIWLTAADCDVVEPPRKPDLVVLNKGDLPACENMIRLRNNSDLEISVRDGRGMAALEEKIIELVHSRLAGAEHGLIVKERHRLAIAQSIRILNDLCSGEDLPLELLAEELRKAARLMGSITGHVDVEDVLGNIFSQFCIGK